MDDKINVKVAVEDTPTPIEVLKGLTNAERHNIPYLYHRRQ